MLCDFICCLIVGNRHDNGRGTRLAGLPLRIHDPGGLSREYSPPEIAWGHNKVLLGLFYSLSIVQGQFLLDSTIGGVSSTLWTLGREKNGQMLRFVVRSVYFLSQIGLLVSAAVLICSLVEEFTV